MGEAHKTYSISLYINGKKLKEYDEGTDSHYFMIPSGREFTFTLLPEDGYKLENTLIWLGNNENLIQGFVLLTGTGSSVIEEDSTFHISISRTSVPQYIKVDVSDELRQMVADGKIESVAISSGRSYSAVLDSETDPFPMNLMNSDTLDSNSQINICVSSEDIDGQSQPAYGVKSICGITQDKLGYNNNSKIYNLSSIKFNADTTITAEIGRLCDISTHHTNARESLALIHLYSTSKTNFRFYVGDEYDINAEETKGKLFGSATFNGNKVDMVREGDDGVWYFKVVPEEGSNQFVLNYSDISTLRITKPENGTIEFQSDIGLIGSRKAETLEDGTQVYTLGTQDEVTLTLTPDSGYELKSATLDGKAVTVTNNQYTFKTEKLADWTFSAEFVEKAPDTVTVTVDCGEHGKVTPGTAAYEKGTNVTLTVTPDSGYKVKSVTLDGKAVTLTNGKYTFTAQADCVFKAEFEKTSTPGGGGSGGRPTRPATPTTDNKPTINGNPGNWSDIEVALRKLPAGGSAVILLNGEVKVPAEVISAIASGKLRVEFVVDTAKSWLVSGADITTPCEADLTLMQGRADSSALRGATGADLIVNGTKIPAELLLKFRSEFAGQFANVYTLSGGALKFLGCEKIGTDGSVTLSGVNGAGEYVVMLCELSDLPGDMNNDGVLNALDAAAILKDIVKSSKGENPLMADLDGNGTVDALDAAAVLKLVTLN